MEMARGGAKGWRLRVPGLKKLRQGVTSLGPHPLRPPTQLCARNGRDTSHTELLVDHPSFGETSKPWGIPRGDKQGNSFLEPVPEDVEPYKEQGHGKQAEVSHEASGG